MSFSPVLGNPKPYFPDSNGDPYVGMRLFFYYTDTSTKLDTQTDSTGLVDNTNPVVIGADGYPTGDVMIYGANNTGYKVVAAPPGSDDPPTSPLWTINKIYPANYSDGEWINPLDATRASSTTATVANSSIYKVGQRKKFTGGADRYGRISELTDATTITIENITDSDGVSSTLHASMDTIYDSILDSDATSGNSNYYEILPTETAANVYNYDYSWENALRYIPRNLHVGIRDGTNTTDLQTYIQNFTAFSGKKRFPAGTYQQSTNTDFVEITAACDIVGDGDNKTIFDGIRFIADQLDYLSFRDFSLNNMHYGFEFFECNHLRFKNVEMKGLSVASARRGIQVYGCKYGRVINCNISTVQYGVWLQDNSLAPTIADGYPKDYDGIVSNTNEDWVITQTSFTSTEGFSYPAGVNVASGFRVKVQGCDFDTITAAGGTASYAVYQGDNTTQAAEDITVTGCTADSLDTFTRIHNADRITITGNSANNLGAYGVLIDGDADPVGGGDQTDITITGNTFDDRITIGDTTTRVTITGNIINGGGYGVHVVGDATHTVEHVTIHGNVINGVTNSGIGLTYCNYVNVHGNIIIDANQGANGTGSSITNAGICVYVNANYVDIKDNQISGSSMQYGINFQTATGAQHQTYRNNVIVGVNTADYRNSYAAAPSAGTWARGERVFYTPSVVDGNNMVLQGWVCTVAGSPGTWVTQYISTVSPAN